MIPCDPLNPQVTRELLARFYALTRCQTTPEQTRELDQLTDCVWAYLESIERPYFIMHGYRVTSHADPIRLMIERAE